MKVIRFKNKDVENNLNNVIDRLKKYLRPHPDPLL